MIGRFAPVLARGLAKGVKIDHDQDVEIPPNKIPQVILLPNAQRERRMRRPIAMNLPFVPAEYPWLFETDRCHHSVKPRRTIRQNEVCRSTFRLAHRETTLTCSLDTAIELIRVTSLRRRMIHTTNAEA